MIFVLLMILGYGYILGRELNPRKVIKDCYIDRIEVQYRTTKPIVEIKSQRITNDLDFYYKTDPVQFEKMVRRQMVSELIDHLDKTGVVFFTKKTFDDYPFGSLQYGEVLYTAYLQLINDPEFYQHRVKYSEQLNHGYSY